MKALLKICLIIPFLTALAYLHLHSKKPSDQELKTTKIIAKQERSPAGEYQIPFEKEVLSNQKVKSRVNRKKTEDNMSFFSEVSESSEKNLIDTFNEPIPDQGRFNSARNYVVSAAPQEQNKSLFQNNSSKSSAIGNHSLVNNASNSDSSRDAIVNDPSRNTNNGAQTRAQIAGNIIPSSTCLSSSIELFDLETINNLKTNPLQTVALNQQTYFSFDPEILGLNLNNPARYLLRTKGCPETFERIVTSFHYLQEVNFSSTMIASLLRTNYEYSSQDLNTASLEVFLRKIEETNFQETFAKLNQTLIYQNDFQRIFNSIDHSFLKDSYPSLIEFKRPNSLNEKVLSTFEIKSFHWDSSYDSITEWYIGEVYQVSGESWSYTPSADSPSSLNIRIKIGQRSSLTNRLDETRPFFSHSFNINVQDLHPVESPMATLSAKSNVLTSQRALYFDFNQMNCETYSLIAITENAALPSEDDFIYQCQEEILYNLVGEDGNINVSFWSKDARNNISSPTEIQTRLDTTPPSLSFINLAQTYDSASHITISFSVSDQNMTSENAFLLEFFDGTSWSSLSQINGITGSLEGEVFEQTFSLPDVITTQARFRVSGRDALDNFAITESDLITLQKIILSVTPSSQTWSDVLNKGSGGSQNFTLTNEGNIEASSCLTPSITGLNASDYSIISNTCLTSLAANSNCQVTVVPSPQSKGIKSASLQLGCSSQVLSLALEFTSINNPPVAADNYSLSLNEDEPLSFSLNAGHDIDDDSLTYEIVSDPSHGILSCTLSACHYAPNLDYNGTDSFTYRVNDGETNSLSNTTVTLNILPVNDAPTVPSTQSITTLEDTELAFNLNEGSDIDGDPLTYHIISEPGHGTLSCLERACTYSPNLNYHGADSFTYRVNDGELNSNIATVSITIIPVNDKPEMIANQTFNMTDQAPLEFTLNGAIDVDLPAQTLRYRLITNVTHGHLENCLDLLDWTENLSCRYHPEENFQGEVSFTYKTFDGEEESDDFSTVTFVIEDKTPSPIAEIAFSDSSYVNIPITNINVLSCHDIEKVFFSLNTNVPDLDSNWLDCNTSTSFEVPILSNNGSQNIYAWTQDEYHNIQTTPATLTVVFDNIAPVINISEKNVNGGSTESISFNITEINNNNLPILIEFFDGSSSLETTINSPTGSLNSHLFSHNITAPTAHNQDLYLRVTYTDLAGNTSIATKNFKTDNEAPVVNLLSLNGGVQEAANNSVTVELSASDEISKVVQYCLKYNDNMKPIANDECWKDVNAPIPGVTPALNISFNNDFFQVGFVKAIYSIYAWVKDEAGVISDNQANEGQDLFLLNFDPGTPPVISNVQATKNDVPTHPIDASEYLVSQGQTIYVKWHASDIEGLDANPIGLAYTTNDHDYIPITTAQDMPNAQNSSCTVETGFTGCTTITAPTSSYFRIRIIAKDDIGTTVYTNTEPFNDSRLRIIAGNTESGLGGSAKTALFFTYGSTPAISRAYKNKLVISEDGKFFYVDPQRGLLWINPATGALSEFISKGPSSTGNNVPISTATVQSVSAIALDFYNHLLIWDNNLIRRVNLQDMTIRTIIGGGNQNGASDTINALNFSLSGFHGTAGTLIPLPNGDILFNSPYNHLTNRRYVASTQMIEPIRLEGQGVGQYPSDTWTAANKVDFAVAFNPTTSEISLMLQGFNKSFTGDNYPIFSRVDLSSGSTTEPYGALPPFNSIFDRGNMQTGLDGRIYAVDRFRRNILRYDPATNSKINILGTGSTATTLCPENTIATSCAVDIDSYFVTKNGRIYFTDAGAIRTINDSNEVITLFGQHRSHGNEGFATLARFGQVVSFQLEPTSYSPSDSIIIHDGISQQFRRFEIGDKIDFLTSQPYGSTGPFRFEVNPESGNIYAVRSQRLYEYDRATSNWIHRVGGGGTRYHAADGLAGLSLSLSNYPRETNGFLNGLLFYGTDHWTGSTYIDQMTKFYDTNDSFRQGPFLGSSSNNRNVSIQLNSHHNASVFRPTNIDFFTDPTDGISKYFFGRLGAAQIYKTTLNGNLELFRTLPRGINSFAVKKTDGLKFFYCNGGRLYQYDAIAQTETHLEWSSSSISCPALQSISYSEARDSVIFVFSQNGLQGIAEYSLAP